MTKKELLENEAFAALPDDTEIVFNTSKNIEARVPLTFNECYYEKRCTNLEEINNAPVNIREHIKAKYGCFFVINAMPISYMRDKLNMTFDL